MIRVLGVSASYRQGNSLFLLERVLESARETDPGQVSTETYSFRGKKIFPCMACDYCFRKVPGQCCLKDDFQELRLKWIAADVVIYAMPVYHVGIPGQLKCFLDRLGNSFYGFYEVASTRHLKIVGAVAQGSHLYGGQELCISYILQHAVLLNCLPVSGDGWQSYLGVGGWTYAEGARDALARGKGAGERDAETSVQAARTLGRRAVQLAVMLKAGAASHRTMLEQDPRYRPLLDRLGPAV